MQRDEIRKLVADGIDPSAARKQQKRNSPHKLRWRWRPKPAVSKPSLKSAAAAGGFEHIQSFFDTTRGQITIGEIPPIRRAALAAVGK